jgi:ribosomal protein L11 methyltransferase
VELPAAAEDSVVTVLWEGGTTGIHVQSGPAGSVVLIAHFVDRPDLAAVLRTALAPLGVTNIRPAEIPDVDWVARFRESFHSFRAGGFQIVPEWDTPPPGSPPDRTIRIRPARAFGTGTHESTRLCLAALESLAGRGPLGRVVDVGAGTGILAVAAARLGAREVTAVDIDPEAVDSARLHAVLNGVDVRLVRGDCGRPLTSGRFDLVLANLTAPLLVERCHEVARLCAPGACAVLAGFLREDAPEIASAYGGLGAADTRFDGEWAALLIEAAA